MKISFAIRCFHVALLASLSCIMNASANLGQSMKEVESRYGTGKSITAQKPAEDAKGYSFNAMSILVEYWKGASSSEQYRKNDGSVISEAEIATTLASNVGSSSWHQTSNDTWVRIDKAAIAYMGDNRKALVVQLYAFHVLRKAL